MYKRAVMMIQKHLQVIGAYQGSIDGAGGAMTDAGVKIMLDARKVEIPAGANAMSSERRMTLCLQLIAKDKGLDADPVDGYWGPVTQNAFEGLIHLEDTGQSPDNWRDDEPSDANPHVWPRDRGNQAEMRAFYGPPGNPPIKKVRCPWKLVLAWDTSQSITHIGCHAIVAGSLEDVLACVYAHYGEAELRRLRLHLYGGCYFNRKKRGGSTWSTHAWAVALDWDPARNQLKWGRDRATLDHRDYDFWWHAWEAEGWVSLGRSRNYDWMHVQAARL